MKRMVCQVTACNLTDITEKIESKRHKIVQIAVYFRGNWHKLFINRCTKGPDIHTATEIQTPTKNRKKISQDKMSRTECHWKQLHKDTKCHTKKMLPEKMLHRQWYTYTVFYNNHNLKVRFPNEISLCESNLKRALFYSIFFHLKTSSLAHFLSERISIHKSKVQ